MKWIITKASKDGVVGAGPNQSSTEDLTQAFKLTGPDDLEAEGLASGDVVAGDILGWAKVAHGFEAVKLTDAPKAVDKKPEAAKVS